LGEFRRQKIWDPVTRLWHWALVIAVCTGWYLGKWMSFGTIEWHFYCGYVVLGLVAFRLIWGGVGPAPVKLRALVPTPSQLINHIRQVGHREPSGTPGHNPLGSLSVIGILMLLLAQGGTGLFISSDDYFETAPLAHMVSDDIRDALVWWHKTLSKFVLAMVTLHISAILFYLFWKKENLVSAMISGWKMVKVEGDDA
tara:strand:+ start:960 stop:1553 length:594 start_codon:yes stop_codon:yes gene_type:complete